MYGNGSSGNYPYDSSQQGWGQSSYSDPQAQYADPQSWYGNGAPGESSRSVPPPQPLSGTTNQLRHQSHASTNSLPSPDGSGSQGKNDKSASKKKKRKTGTLDTPDGDDKEKRIKTGRACDACRTKKIRCDVLPSTTSPGGRESQQICAHCKQYDLECTWFLPITETRFKKRKTADEPAEAPFTLKPSATASPAEAAPREVPTRTEGPTSLSFLLHTSLPAGASEAYDLREHNRWEVSEDGDGQLRVTAPPLLHGQDEEDLTRGYNRLARPTLNAATISALVNAYFDHVAPLFPVILRSDFAAKPNPSPLLLYSICGLGATRRQFPREIFAGVRGMINGLLRSNDILSDARFEHVQALLLIAQVGDLHAQPTAATASASLVRLASAIRMAQDLGLHRESSLRAQTAQDLAYVELRRRVWAACVILDRWYGAALGIPLMVDLLDCDVLLPAPYEIVPDSEPSSWRIEPSYLYLAEHLKLSILIGRVLKAIYSPTGLKHATDEQLQSIFADMTNWKQNLPNELKFRGAETPPAAGLLHMSHAALQFLFWRVFMRITYVVPSHLNFRLSVNAWTTMMNNSAEALQWLSANDTALDTVFIFAYTATSCALIQYHTWARRKDANALELLRLVKETATRWEVEVQPDQMSIRRKTCETMTLLHEAALKTNPELEEPQDRPAAVNPTPGVSMRQQVGKVAFMKDDTHPHGGFWVARSDEDRKGGGVMPTSVILLEDLDPNAELTAKAYATLGVVQPTPTQNPPNTQNGQAQTIPTHQPTGNEPFGSGPVMQTPVDLQGMNNSVNVNPQINVEHGIESFAQDPVIDLMSLTAPMSVNNPIDLSSLDSLPMSSFDFPSWEQYFAAINTAVSPDRDGFGQM